MPYLEPTISRLWANANQMEWRLSRPWTPIHYPYSWHVHPAVYSMWERGTYTCRFVGAASVNDVVERTSD